MKTPEEIFNKLPSLGRDGHYYHLSKNSVIDAMANYALQFQEHTFEFAEWLSRKRTDFIFNGRGYWHNSKQLTLTTRELYNEFLNDFEREFKRTKKDY